MDIKEKILLNSYTAKQSVDKDTFINIQFNNSERLLPPDELNRTLDIGKQFNKERQVCTFYRISGKLNPLISNVLFNVSGNDSWNTFNTPIFLSDSLDNEKDLTYAESIKKHLKEIDGWYGYFDPILTGSGMCNFFDMEPKRERFSFVPDTTNIKHELIKNWEFTISYPYDTDKTQYLINGGIIMVSKKSVVVGGIPMTAVGVPIKHNLVTGNTIKIIGSNIDGIYEIKRLGLDDGSYKEYYFCINVSFDTLLLDNDSRFKKIYKDFECEYYFRKFKKIKTRFGNTIEPDDYEIYKLAFSENIYSDDIAQFIFNEDIDVANLVDNLNRPLSELFLTVIKTDSNNIFTNVSSGIETPDITELNNYTSQPYFKDIPVIQLIHTNKLSYTPLETNITINNLDFYGDVVEYNVATLTETVLANVSHRFNTINREKAYSPRLEGYMYNAHYQLKIRDFSTYIEQGDASTSNLPEYAVNLGDGRFIWRDLLDIGRTDINIDTLNYPFTNGCHYLYDNFLIEVKRQDPFDIWNLYTSNFPADPIGNSVTNKFRVNVNNNIC
jgi:hypothetical protein